MLIIKIIIFTFLALVTFIPSFAVVNIEALRSKNYDKGWSGELNLSSDKKEGNTRKLSQSLSSIARYLAGSSEFLGYIDHQKGQSNDVKDIDSSTFHVRYTYFVQRRIAPEVYFQLQENQFTRLSYRGLAGAGARVRVYRSESTSVFLGLGGFYFEEELEEKFGLTDHGRDYGGRYNTYISYNQKLNQVSSASMVAYFQPRADDHKDYRVYATLSLDVKAFENLTLSLYYKTAYDNEPPQDVEKQDSQHGSQIKFSF